MDCCLNANTVNFFQPLVMRRSPRPAFNGLLMSHQTGWKLLIKRATTLYFILGIKLNQSTFFTDPRSMTHNREQGIQMQISKVEPKYVCLLLWDSYFVSTLICLNYLIVSRHLSVRQLSALHLRLHTFDLHYFISAYYAIISLHHYGQFTLSGGYFLR